MIKGIKIPIVELTKEQIEGIWEKHGIRLNEEIFLKKEQEEK